MFAYRIRTVVTGDIVPTEMNYSEVNMFMGVAGKILPVRVLESAGVPLNADGTNYCAPITEGESGIYRRADGTRYMHEACEACDIALSPTCYCADSAEASGWSSVVLDEV